MGWKRGVSLKGPIRLLGQDLGGNQAFFAKGPLHSVDISAKGKAKVDSKDSEAQLRGSTLKCGSNKLWNALLPPSLGCRQGGRSRSEPLTIERSLLVCDALPMEDDFEAGTQLDQCFSASPRHSSGFRKKCFEKGMLPTRGDADQRTLLIAHFLSKGKEKMCNFSKGEDGAGIKGFVGCPHCGSSVTVFPYFPATREKGLTLWGTVE